jgi:two-component system sensor histidine kinase BaeS
MSKRFVLTLVGLVLAAIVVAEVLLDPPSSDRTNLVLIFTLPALAAAACVPVLRSWVSSRPSVAGAALAVGAISLALGAIISSAASNAMFLSSHDYRLFLVVLMLSSGLALAVGQQLSRPLARDIRRLGHVATAVANGDLGMRTGITRRDEVGQTARAVDVMVDRLREAEEERVRLSAARQHLLTGVGHDLRTPLAAMRAATESLQDGVATDADRYLAVIAGHIQIVDQLIDQLFAFARIESGGVDLTAEPMSLAELADDAVDSLSPLAERAGVRVRLDADGPAIVTADPAALSRVLRNLIDNAIRHSPTGGSVTITVRHSHDDAVVQVDDEGDGFPIEFRESAFEPFTRADTARRPTGSSGLGLAIARAIVDAHGGSIEIVDVPHGSVRFRLPTRVSTRGSTTGHLDTTTAPYSPVMKDGSMKDVSMKDGEQ